MFVVCGLPAGAVADRRDRRRLLIGVETMRMINAVVVAAAIFGGWVVFAYIAVAAVIQGAGTASTMLARKTATRDVVGQDRLIAAFAQEEARSSVSGIAGPLPGGALYSVGRSLPFGADALSNLVALLCILAARVPRGRHRTDPPAGRITMAQDIGAGLRDVWGQRAIRALVGCRCSTSPGPRPRC